MLSEPGCWESFYRYKTSLCCTKRFSQRLREFTDGKEYLPVCERINRGEEFPLPGKSLISKLDTAKKRTVYTYPEPENTVLKMLTFLMLRKYDGIFSDNLYSFRPARTAAQGFLSLARRPGIDKLWCYKADISNYFNSADVGILLSMLGETLKDDPRLLGFLSALLKEPRVSDRGSIVTEQKGMMAGTPISAFCANIYLRGLDEHFASQGIPYARYSDDIVCFAETEQEIHRLAQTVRDTAASLGLSINPDKECFTAPDEGFVFLGLSYQGGCIDAAPASVRKLKAKMRRKCRALKRWQQRKKIEPENAAVSFIRIFNSKLFDAPSDNDLSWARWYFPVINTDRSLRSIDRYAQDCLRYLISGKRTASRFRVRYSDLKELGYRSLAAEYHKQKKLLHSTV